MALNRLASVAIAISSALGMVGCAADDGPMEWEEFQQSVYREPDTGFYIVNGDELAETIDDLRDVYYMYLESWQLEVSGISRHDLPLIVNRAKGKDDKYTASQAQNLTYCIASGFSGTEHSALASAMTSATGAWEGSARVSFTHLTNLDGSGCTSSSAFFKIRATSGQPYLARAFFPSTGKKEIIVDKSSFGNIKPWSLAGIMRHELGHTLGFRHEHTRPESGACFEDTRWRALTAYDSSSVMHYPQCNGTNGGDLNLTALDRAGAAALYP